MTKRVNLQQLGVTGLERYGGYVNEEFLPELRYPRAAKVYKEMADNDPVIGAMLFMSEMLIRAVDWRVEAASDSAEDKEHAEFLESCMHDMSQSWASFINEVLSMFTYGFSFHEVVYKVRKGPHTNNPKYKSKYDDGRIGWRKISSRAQATLLEWEFDEDGDVCAFIQLAPPKFDRVRIPMQKGLLFRTRVSKDNPEGKSLLRNAYRPWYFKKRIEEIESIGIERDLAGLPILKAPEGVDLWDTTDPLMVQQKAVAENIVTNVRNDATSGVLLPYGWEFELASTGGSRTFDTNAIITRWDFRIASTMLADIVLMGSEKAGSFALAELKGSTFSDALEAQLQNIADVINSHAVAQLFSLNGIWPKNGLPRIVPTHVKKPSIKEVALLLRTANLDITEDLEFHNFVRDVCGLEHLSESEFKDLYERIEAKQAAQEQQNQPAYNTDDTIDNDFEQSDMAYDGGSYNG